jgi:hypothetical protein
MMNPTPAVLIGALALILTATAFAQADPGTPSSGQEIRIGKDSASARVVSVEYEGRFSYVRIETAESGAPPNEHPLNITAPALRSVLVAAVLPGKKSDAVFNNEELDEIAGPLAAALAKASASQDVSFAVSGRHGFLGPLAPRLTTTARVFRHDGRLQVIFGRVRHDFESQFRATGYLMPFEPGSRAKSIDGAAKVALASDTAGTVRRADWVALRLDAPTAAAAPSGAPAGAAAAAGAAATAAPTPTTPPMAPAAQQRPVAPAVAPGPPTQPEADALYRGAAERLRALERLRKDGLITEQEYQDKRREILKAI